MGIEPHHGTRRPRREHGGPSGGLPRWRLLLGALALTVAVWRCVAADIPGPGDPRRLIDLRWLARPPRGKWVIVDKLSDSKDPVAADGVLADIQGPGVLRHLICDRAGGLRISVDGKDVFQSVPAEAWPRVYPAPKAEKRGNLPFAFPLVHQAGQYAHCILPIPFRDRLVIRRTDGKTRTWLTVQRLVHAPETEFSTAPGSLYMARIQEVQNALLRRQDALTMMADGEISEFTTECRTRSTATIADLPRGPGELVGMRLHVHPGALELLRELVLAITIDGVTTVRMPLVDFVGVSHPWPHAWAPMAGDWAAGIIHPYRRSGGRVQRGVIVYAKLPIPFSSTLRLAISNRSERLPVVIRGQFSTVPLKDTGNPTAVLCGTSRVLDLDAGRNVLHTFSAAPGRLVGLSLFTTGHGRDWSWRRQSSVRLTSPGGDVIAAGPGLLPFALQGASGNLVFGAPTWNHNSLEPVGRCGAGRHFWLDPIPLAGNEELAFALAGAGGPTRGEAAVVWYHLGPAPPAAPDHIPPRAETLPPIRHAQPGRPTNPAGWWLEAEELANSAEATAGTARAETVGAKDAFASADAYLAWNAVKPGDVLDLLADLPPTRYVRLWVHRLLFPAGGVFKIQLAAVDEPVPDLDLARSPADFRSRVLGLKAGPASIDCYGVWPHRQAYRFEMPIMLNPAPGVRGRLRFICVSKPASSRGYLLAIDQLGMDAAPVTPAGWNEWEEMTPVRLDRTVTATPMSRGRVGFCGWGGQRLTVTSAAGGAGAFLLFDPERPAGGKRLVVRGMVESGQWSISTGTGPGTPLRADSAKKPMEWTVPLEPESGAGPLRVTVRCQDGPGSLLLDAWRYRAP